MNNSDSNPDSIFYFNPFPTVLNVLIAIVIGWGLSLIDMAEQVRYPVIFCTMVCSALFLVVNCSVVSGSRSGLVIKSLAWCFFITEIITNLLFALLLHNYKVCLIFNSLWTLIFLGIVYKIYKSNQ